MSTVTVLGVPVEHTTCEAATAQILAWARRRESRSVYLVNTHMLVEASEDPAFHAVLEEADLSCADGMPVAWMQRLLGAPSIVHVRGADLMSSVLGAAASSGVRVGLYGGKPEVLDELVRCRRRSAR
jgi:N-acetylglucosaminyldiphosphoundecaprenol N-acetyl-beta-D-mannosaminyltransferase